MANTAGVKGVASGLDVTRVLPWINNDWAAQNSPGQAPSDPQHVYDISKNWGSAPAPAEGFAAAQRWWWALDPVKPSSRSLVAPGRTQSQCPLVCLQEVFGRYDQCGDLLLRCIDLLGEAAAGMERAQGVLSDNSVMVAGQAMASAVTFGNWCPAMLQCWQEDNHSRQEACQGAEAAWHSGEENQLQPRGTWGHSVVAEIYWGFQTRLVHSKLRALHDRNVTCPSS